MSNADIDALKAAFVAADAGDPVPLVSLYDDEMTWAGFTLDGSQRVYTKGEFLEAFGVLAKLDESRNVVTDAFATKEGLVVATVQAYRRLGDEVLDVELIFAHRFVDGKVTRGADLVPADFEAYWARTGITL